MSVVIIDSGGANIGSVGYALERIGADYTFSAEKDEIQNAKWVILPGVGYAAKAMEWLARHDLIDVIRELTQPVLGICVGMQLLFEHLQEGDVAGLGIIKGEVKPFAKNPLSEHLSLPHMGWNAIKWTKPIKSMEHFDSDYFYFIHSYYTPISEYTLATCDYGTPFSAICKKDNFVGIQCHPEKSAQNGATFLKAFLDQTL